MAFLRNRRKCPCVGPQTPLLVYCMCRTGRITILYDSSSCGPDSKAEQRHQIFLPFVRPISLLYYDFKILTKVLVSRVIKILLSLINIDQMDFMPGKSTDINLRRVLTHLQLPS